VGAPWSLCFSVSLIEPHPAHLERSRNPAYSSSLPLKNVNHVPGPSQVLFMPYLIDPPHKPVRLMTISSMFPLRKLRHREVESFTQSQSYEMEKPGFKPSVYLWKQSHYDRVSDTFGHFQFFLLLLCQSNPGFI
jgi:hypothetical protein